MTESNDLKLGYVLKIYHEDKFMGYIKSYRKCGNMKYRFDKTKNVNDAIQFSKKGSCENTKNKLTLLIDPLFHKGSFDFEITEITEREVRKSKLYTLKNIKIYTGIFKNKIS